MIKNVPFIDLNSQYALIGKEIEESTLRVLRSGQYILGPEVERLEASLAEFAGVRYVASCASGTDALVIALMAKGVGQGDVVITTPFTFVASAECIAMLGAKPLFVDVDPVTYNICPVSIERAVTSGRHENIKGIIGVDIFGLPADYDQINRIAAEHGLFVIEDAAQSFGSMHGSKRAGALAEIGCTSFFPAKPLGGVGDGGALFTDDQALDTLFRSIRVHGQGSDRYENVRLGLTGRLDALQAAALGPKLKIFPEELKARQRVAEEYATALASVGAHVTVPSIPDNYRSAWAQYCLLAESSGHRQRLMDALKAVGVPTAIYYPKPLHLQTVFADLGYKMGDLPVSEDIASRIFAVPMHPYLDTPTIVMIASTIASVPS
jgi:UDP-2-acetamido-2-deoxy-ribo-hexuluronate aminotransferase